MRGDLATLKHISASEVSSTPALILLDMPELQSEPPRTISLQATP